MELSESLKAIRKQQRERQQKVADWLIASGRARAGTERSIPTWLQDRVTVTKQG